MYYIIRLFKKIKGSSIYKSKIDSTSKVESGSQIFSSTFAKHSFCGYDCEIINADIGPFCSISNSVKIGNFNHPIDWASTSPVFSSNKDSIKKKYYNHDPINQLRTRIGADVWIGTNVLVKQGVDIGVGSIIGMGSVVVKNVEPYSIVAGNPARLIRYRFDKEVINKLLTYEWWKLSDEQIANIAPYVKSVDKFVTILESIRGFNNK